MNKHFNLIEIIIVVLIMGFFSTFVIMNLGTNTEVTFEDKATHINLEILQSAVDFYKLYNDKLPSKIQPTETIPQEIDMSLLIPKYMRPLAKTRYELTYWVDHCGRVWASTIQNPDSVTNQEGTITWLPVEGAEYYNVYRLKVKRDNVVGSIRTHELILEEKILPHKLNDNLIFHGNSKYIYLVSAVDREGLESAPTGDPIITEHTPEYSAKEKPEVLVKPIAVIKGVEEDFTINTLINFKCASFHPLGYKIVNREWEGNNVSYSIEGIYSVKLRVQDEKGVWSDWVEKKFFVSGGKTSKNISVGFSHSFYIDKDNSLFGFGSNEFGQLGVALNLGGYISEPIKIMDNVESVTAGKYHTIVKKLDGTVWTFGSNYYGQLGHSENVGTNKPNYIPKQIMTNVKEIIAGEYHTFVIKENNESWGFGNNDEGQLGIEDKYVVFTPKLIMKDVREIDTNETHTLFIKTDDTLWGCGNNHNNQFSDVTGNRGNKTISPPVYLMANVQTARAGENFTLIITKNGTAMSAGGNKYGQLGVQENSGTGNPVGRFVKIMDDVRKIEAGKYHGFLIKNDDSLWGFGSNIYGQIGLNIFSDLNPIPVKIMDDVLNIVAGEYHTIIMKKDHSIWVLGRNDKGQLGTDGVLGNTNIPIKIFPKD